jgi:FtsP/CotA-like multicopper oxidase with cupredoxin domain
MLRCCLPVFPALALTVALASAQTPVSSVPSYLGASTPRLAIAPGAAAAPPTVPRSELSVVRPNANTDRAGALHDGVLTVVLEAKESAWHLNGPDRPPMTIEAFSEPGKPPLMPGPLVRAPQGTEIRLSVRNSLRLPLTFLLPASIRGGPDQFAAMDSIVVAPGAVGLLTTRAAVPGNYVYRAMTPTGTSRTLKLAGLLAGGLVIDTTGGTAPPRDHVFVIMLATDSAFAAYVDSANGNLQKAPPGVARILYTINGRSWPNTERIAATVGDSIHWRVINASFDVHPMHLHGFYYRVDGFSGPFADSQGRPSPGQMVVTQFMTPFSAMSISWLPDRPGNWLFHCHFALHLLPDSLSAAPDDPHRRDMVGLVLGVNVADRPGARAAVEPTPVRHLRLIAIADSMPADERRPQEGAGILTPLHDFAADSVPSMRFVLEEHGHRVDTGRDFSPELDLTRGVPVSIMIVNHLAEPTSVHWHGIEVEDSYVDGVPGFSGAGRRLAPAIAPGDSFEARFTPPRAGTFMYHAHMDEVREDLAGLEGALIVRDPGVAASADGHVFFLKGLRNDVAHPLEVNGEANPDTVILHAGRPARLRFLNLSTANPVPWVWLTARPDSTLTGGKDTMVVSWRPVAKDGLELTTARQGPQPARQLVSMGETYDFEYTPGQKGTLRLEIRTSATSGVLLVRVPIRVE